MAFTKIFAGATAGIVADLAGQEALVGGLALDIFTLGRDGQRDRVIDFQIGIDRLDLSDYFVRFDQLELFERDEDGRFVVDIRGERLQINVIPFVNEVDGTVRDTLEEVDFVFAPEAPAAVSQIVFDRDGATKLKGTPNPDIFIFQEDRVRDRVVRYEDDKDKIDIKIFDVDFTELTFVDRKPGRVMIKFEDEKILVRDRDGELTSADFTAEDFILL